MSNQLQVTGAAKIRNIQGPVVANNGVIDGLDGLASQYVRGDGALADFPTTGGGGSSVSYYLNGSVSQGTIGGVAYKQLSKTPVIGGGTDFTISSPGYVASFITDAGDPAADKIPGGNWNIEFYFNASAIGGTPYFYAEIYKYDGTTFTLIASNAAAPEYINSGTTIDAYYTAIPVPETVLATTDRIAIRVYVETSSKTITFHTEDTTLDQVVTTFSRGLTTLNNLTKQVQYFAVGSSGTDFNIASSVDTHTFNIPSASALNRGLITTGTQTIAGSKTFDNSVKNEYGTFIKENQSDAVPIGYKGLFATTNGLEVTNSNTSSAFLNFNNAGNYTYTYPSASGTIALTSNLTSYVPYSGATGAVNLGFNSLTTNSINLDGNSASGVLNIKSNTTVTTAGASYVSLVSGNVNQLSIWFGAGNMATFTAVSLSTSRTYSLPDATGTIALTSNLSSYVPYTGATTNVNLGTNNLSSNGLSLEGNGSTYGGALSIKQYTSAIAQGSGYTSLSASGASKLFLSFSQGGVDYKGVEFSVASITNNTTRTYTLPNVTGTLALTSDLSSYVPYTGATGAVNLGNYELTSSNLIAGGTSGNAGMLHLKSDVVLTSKGNGYTSIGAYAGSGIIQFQMYTGAATYKSFTFSIGGLTDNTNRQFTLPDTSGTVALTSDLSSYVTLATTQTISGQKSFTSLLYANSFTDGYLTITGGKIDRTTIGSSVELQFDGNGPIRFFGSTLWPISFSSTTGVATFSNSIIASSFIKSGGTSSQYLMADGSTSTLTNPVTGTGTTNYLPKFTGTSTIGNSAITDDGTTVTLISRALTGTSATFSGTITSGTGSGNTLSSGSIDVGKDIGLAATQGIVVNNARVLAFASLGAATFSSSVGVNGATITKPLSVFAPDASGNIRLTRAGTSEYMNIGTFAITVSGNDLQIQSGTGNTLQLNPSGGNLLIGTTTDSVYKVRIDGGLSNNGNSLFANGMVIGAQSNGSDYPAIGYNVKFTSTATYNYLVADFASFIKFNSGRIETYTAGASSGTMSPTTGPFVANGGTSWTNGSSDIRKKKNFELTQGLAEVLQIESIKYHFNWEDDNAVKRLGFKAQNLQTLIPEMVSETGEIAEDGTPYLTIIPDYILPVLVKAMQEQQSQIEAQDAKIEELKALIAAK